MRKQGARCFKASRTMDERNATSNEARSWATLNGAWEDVVDSDAVGIDGDV